MSEGSRMESRITELEIKISYAEDFEDFPGYFAINIVGKVSAQGGNSILEPTFGTTRIAAMVDRLDLPDTAAAGQRVRS